MTTAADARTTVSAARRSGGRSPLVRAYLLLAVLLAAVSAAAYPLRLDALPVAGYWPKRIVLLLAISGVTACFLFAARPWTWSDTRSKFAWALRRSSRRMQVGFALLAFALTALIATAALHAVPMSGDENTYVLQANMFAHGRVSADPAPAPVRSFFAQAYVFQAGDKLISQYPPGWSAVLAAASLAGIPHVLINPLVGALTVLALWQFAARRSGADAALVATLVMTSSAFFLLNSASFYNGSIVALFGMLFVASAAAFLDRPGAWQALGLGVWFSAIAVTRHFDALVFALPVAIEMLRRGTMRHWRLAPLAAAAALPLLAALVLYDWRATGAPWTIPQTLRDPNDGLLGAYWHVTRVTAISVKRVIELAEWVSVPFVAALAWALVQKARQRRLAFYDLYGPLFLAGYWLQWSDGGYRWGPRYILPALPFMALAVADQACWMLRTRRSTGLAHLLAISVLVSLTQLPSFMFRSKQLIEELQDVRFQVAQAGLHDAVVLVTAGPGQLWPMDPSDLARNGLTLDGDVIYAHGPRMFAGPITPAEIDRTVHALRDQFPRRSVWLYERVPGRLPGQLVER